MLGPHRKIETQDQMPSAEGAPADYEAQACGFRQYRRRDAHRSCRPSTLSTNDTNSLAYRSQLQSKLSTLAFPPAINRARTLGKSASSIRSAASLALSGS